MAPANRDVEAGDGATLTDDVMRSLRLYVGAVETYIAAASHARHLHRTDLTALSIVMDQSHRGVPVTPGVLSRAVKLSASATTSMIDRLEKAGHVVRATHPDDRRSVVIELTERAEETGDHLFRPLADATETIMSSYTPEQLQLVVRFLDDLTHAAGDITHTVAGDAPPSP